MSRPSAVSNGKFTLEVIAFCSCCFFVSSFPWFSVDYLYPERQMLRLEPSKSEREPSFSSLSFIIVVFPEGKPLPDEETLGELNLPAQVAQLYFRDLGRQIGWKTVRIDDTFVAISTTYYIAFRYS